MAICQVCTINEATTIDYRNIDNNTSKFRSCDSCRLLGLKPWLEIREDIAKMRNRCRYCIYLDNEWTCSEFNRSCVLVEECEAGKLSMPAWFKEHIMA